MADLKGEASESQSVATKSLPLKPFDGEFVGSLWENDQRLLFELAAKINDIIAVVNDLQPSDPDAKSRQAEAQS